MLLNLNRLDLMNHHLEWSIYSLTIHLLYLSVHKLNKPMSTIYTLLSKQDSEINYLYLTKNFLKIIHLPISLHFKNFFVEQIIRTLTSKNKLFKPILTSTNLCIKCNTIIEQLTKRFTNAFFQNISATS